jgi:hypothetical protein
MYTPQGTHCIEKGGMKALQAELNTTRASAA